MKLDLNKLNKYKNDGWIRSQTHPSLPLLIWNYTKQTQYDGKWDDITILCRGLVTDTKGNVVAHPFRKFFNYGELKAWNKVPTGPYRAFEKLDGSIIQVFNYQGEWVISSKGSFNSDQSSWAEEILVELLTPEGGDPYYYMNPGYNYIFELIHPENRIVLDYGQEKNLILLGIIGKDGSEQHITGNPTFKTSPELFSDFDCDNWEDIRQEIPNDKEGYVIVFESGKRMKLKGDEYLRLHRIVTQTTYRDIWTALKDGHDMKDFLERMPDEWMSWFYQKVGELYLKRKLICDQVRRDWQHGIHLGLYYGNTHDSTLNVSRKEVAQYFQTCQHPNLLFNIIDGRDNTKPIWEMIEPHHEKAFML